MPMNNTITDPASAAAILKRGLFNQQLQRDYYVNTDHPATGVISPVFDDAFQQSDPQTAVDTFTGGQSADVFNQQQPWFQAAHAGGTSGGRNNALTGALAKFLGVQDNGSISQTDMQSAFDTLKNRDLSDKITAATAPIDEKGMWDTSLSRESMKDSTAQSIALINAQAKLAAAGAKPGAPALDPQTAQYLADNALRDRSILTQVPAAMRPQVEALMAQSGQDPVQMTNQTKQMSEAANDLLPMIDQIQQRASQLQAHGALGLVNSPLRQFLVKHGAGSLLGYTGDPNIADEAGRFQTDLGLLQSGVARAHAGARGAGNSDLAARFERLMNAGGDLPTFLGELQGVRDLLGIYAKHLNPNANSAPMSGPASGGQDLGADWHLR